MYQELQLFEESFNSEPVWSTEGNDLPLPPLAVGDQFEHLSMSAIYWRRPPRPGQVFRVVALKHVFKDSTDPGPTADYSLMVAVALDDFADRQEAALDEAETKLEDQTRRGDFLSAMLIDLAQHTAPELRNKLVQGVVSSMKAKPAHGIEDEAESAWEEAARILQADGHGLADMQRGDVESDVRGALKKLGREDRLTLWLEEAQLNDWFSDDWPKSATAFDPLTHLRGALDLVEEQLTRRVLSLLYAHELAA